jgi:hypothetical protein
VQTAGDGQETSLLSQSTPILNEDGDPIWKVLVFDNKGRDVISSVLRVNDLRAWGVTIHLYVCVILFSFLYLLTVQKYQLAAIPYPRCPRRLPC